jgi:hypothetical protein
MNTKPETFEDYAIIKNLSDENVNIVYKKILELQLSGSVKLINDISSYFISTNKKHTYSLLVNYIIQLYNVWKLKEKEISEPITELDYLIHGIYELDCSCEHFIPNTYGSSKKLKQQIKLNYNINKFKMILKKYLYLLRVEECIDLLLLFAGLIFEFNGYHLSDNTDQKFNDVFDMNDLFQKILIEIYTE